MRDKGSRGHSGLRVVPGSFLRNSKASELLKRAKITTRVSLSSRVAIFTRSRYSLAVLFLSTFEYQRGRRRGRKREEKGGFPPPPLPLLFVPVTQAVTEKNDGLLVDHPSQAVCRVSPCYYLPSILSQDFVV